MTKFSFSRHLMIGLAMLSPFSVSAQPVESPPAAQSRTFWVNPYNDVKVEIADCSGKLCGWVAWATPEAEQEARDGGTPKLVGTELLQDYKPTGPNSWQGRVFVPDMGRTFYSTIALVQPDTLKISGCIMGGLICKSQVWHRA